MQLPSRPAQSGLPPGYCSSRAFTTALAVLAVLTAVYAAWPLWRAVFPLEIEVDDVWNAYNADAAFGPRALYSPAVALIANNYPPLSFYLIGFLSRLTFDAV
jgi:hypothetical protein